jgi:hydroxymethylglutaryl-CoA reductase
VIVPMAVEEDWVIAGASYMARLVRAGGGFEAEADPPHMIGQVQLLEIADLGTAAQAVEAESDRLLGILQGMHPAIQDLGGGPVGLEVRPLQHTPRGPMLIVHIIFDTRDAMGANAVNSAAERLASELETIEALQPVIESRGYDVQVRSYRGYRYK